MKHVDVPFKLAIGGGEVDMLLTLGVSVMSVRPAAGAVQIDGPPVSVGTVPPPDLWYKFDSDLYDYSGNNKHLGSGSFGFVEAQHGNGLASGSNAARAAGTIDMAINGTYSISMFVKAPANDQSYQAVGVGPGGAKLVVNVQNSGGTVSALAGINDAVAAPASTGASAGDMIHLVLVVSGGSARLYADGVAGSAADVSGQAGNYTGDLTVCSNLLASIGAVVDDLAVWKSTALDGTQINAIRDAAGDVGTLV